MKSWLPINFSHANAVGLVKIERKCNFKVAFCGSRRELNYNKLTFSPCLAVRGSSLRASTDCVLRTRQLVYRWIFKLKLPSLLSFKRSFVPSSMTIMTDNSQSSFPRRIFVNGGGMRRPRATVTIMLMLQGAHENCRIVIASERFCESLEFCENVMIQNDDWRRRRSN